MYICTHVRVSHKCVASRKSSS